MKNLCSFLIFLFITNIAFTQTRESDSLALVQIYNEFNGTNWTNADNWNTDKSLDEWKGVRLYQNRVISLNISQFNAIGPFPQSIFELDKITTLTIDNAEITGGLPKELIKLQSLKRFTLTNCNIDGVLPKIFDKLPNLEAIIIQHTELTGELPDITANLSQMYAQANQFNGSIPESWRNMNLKFIHIQNNNLVGNIDILNSCKSIVRLIASDNNWDVSPFPEWLDDLNKLSNFTCKNCNLQGKLPSDLDFSKIKDYSSMHISGNKLSGDISLLYHNPSSNHLLYLTANSNNFSGELPLQNTGKFSHIQVKENNYSSISNWNTFQVNHLDIRNNNFNYKALTSLQKFIEEDSLIGINYNRQNNRLNLDTIIITKPTLVEIMAGDDHQKTQYLWKRRGIDMPNQKNSSLKINVTDVSSNGHYECHMTNSDFPELKLQRNKVVIQTKLTAVSNNSSLNRLIIFPNPAVNYLIVKSGSIIEGQSYNIYSSGGSIVHSGVVKSDQKINIQKLINGQYTIQFIDQQHVRNITIIKL